MPYKITARPGDLDYYLANSVVAIGWSGIPLHTTPDADLEATVRGAFAEGNNRRAGRHLSQLRRFRALQVGERLIVPGYGVVYLATVTAERGSYVPEVSNRELSNQRGVRFQLSVETGQPIRIPRDVLTEGLARRLRVMGTYVQDLGAFTAEIDDLFAGRTISMLDAEHESRARDVFAEGLLKRLRDGSSNLRAGGLGLEDLVVDLMSLDGYRASRLSKKTFTGIADADVLAEREDITGMTQVYIQVKHHGRYSGGHGVNQLSALREDDQVDPNATLVLLTTGDIPEALMTEVEERNLGIELVGGVAFVEFLIERLPRLDRKWWRQLRISEVPGLMG